MTTTDPTQRALEQMEKANTIFESCEKTWWSQLVNMVIWAAELAAVAAAAFGVLE